MRRIGRTVNASPVLRYNRHVRPTTVLLALLLATACASSAPPEFDHLVLVGTTDLHGSVERREEVIGATRQTIRWGGLDLFGGYLENLRQAYPDRVVLLDSGDVFQGTLVSNLYEGQPVIESYNLLGYGAGAVGNHEFDYGPAGPRSVATAPGEDQLGALKRLIATARHPMLAANIVEKRTGRRPEWVRATTMIDRGGVRLGIIGLITEQTPSATFPTNVEHLQFLDPAAVTIEAARSLRTAGARAIIVTAHLGGVCTDLDDPLDTSSCDPDTELFELARNLPPGTVDVIFGGHTHRRVRQYVNGIALAQAASHGREFAVVDLWVDRSKPSVRTAIRMPVMICEQLFAGTEGCDPRQPPASISLVPATFEGRPVVPRADVSALLAPYVDAVRQKRAEKLGVQTTAPITREGDESPLGSLTTDMLRLSFPQAQIAIQNPGGLRADLPGPKELTYGDVYEAFPFDNLITLVTLTGSELREVLRHGASGEFGFFQVSGVKLVIDPQPQTTDGRRRGSLVSASLSDGTPIRDDATYVVAMNDFLAAGGDGLLPFIKDIPPDRIITTPVTIRDAVIGGMKKLGRPVRPYTDRRIALTE